MRAKLHLSLTAFSIAFILLGCTDNYREGLTKYEKGDYEFALNYFNRISENDRHYHESQTMIAKIDSIFKEQRIIKEKEDSIARVTQLLKDRIIEIEKEQKKIFSELQLLQDKSISEADRRFPNPNDWEKHSNIVEELDKKNEQKIIELYNISKDSLYKIIVKATENQWWK